MVQFTSALVKFALCILLLALGLIVSIQFSCHFNESSTLQLINGVSNDFQKLLKYFNGTAIFSPFFLPLFLSLLPFFLPLFPLLPIRFALYLTERALSSLHYHHYHRHICIINYFIPFKIP